MVRALIIALNFFVVWIISIIAGVPSATVTAPDKVQKGESFTVNVKINPNGEEKFLRFSMDLPPGWTAEKIAEDGSTYLMEEQTVKFIWSRVGKRDELNISFKLNPPPDAEGTFEFPCKVSHQVKNLPSNVLLDPLKVIVGKAGTPQNGKYIPEHGDSTANPSANVSVTRIVPTEPVTGEFLVDVTIHKGELGSFIKLQDSLPEGFTARPVTNDGGQWSFEKGIVRIEWYNPNKSNPTLHVQYKVIVSPDVSGRYTINGHVSYVENMDNKLIALEPATIVMKEDPALVNTDNKTQDPLTNNNGNTGNANDNKTQDPLTNNNGNTGNANDNKTQDPLTNNNGNNGNANDNKTQDPLTNNNGNNGNNGNTNDNNNNDLRQDPKVNQAPGVFFTVQVAAMRRRVEASYYQNTFGLSTVNVEQIEGLNKYTTGSFVTYQDARNSRETVRNKGVEAPFVVAYSNGKRITVQEALMITSQKWIR